MGYTHSFSRPKILPVRKFLACAEDCRTMCVHLTRMMGFTLWEDFQDASNIPVFSRHNIRFNGVGELGHETFVILREDEHTEGFCKTARKPYDSAVCACLIVLNHHFPKFKISSDGDNEEENWPVARQACQEVLGYGEDFELVEAGDDFGRMGIGGLPVKRMLVSDFRRKCIIKLACGWAMNRYDRRTYLPFPMPRGHRIGVYESDYDAAYSKKEKLLFTARNFAEARQKATVMYLKQRFAGGRIDEFLGRFEDTFDWSVLTIATDYLGDYCDDKTRNKILALLPRGVFPLKSRL